MYVFESSAVDEDVLSADVLFVEDKLEEADESVGSDWSSCTMGC